MLQPWQRRIRVELDKKNILKESILASVPDSGEDLTKIKGIGEGTQRVLKEAGIKTEGQLLEVWEDRLKEILNPLSLKVVLTYIKTKKWEI